MTTYTAIPNGDIDQDSPITQPLMTALRDNLLAVQEGDPTAPKLVGMTREISQTVVSGSPATVDFFFDETLYDEITLSIGNLKTSGDNGYILLQLSDNGTTFEAGGTAYSSTASLNGAAATIATSAGYIFVSETMGNATGEDGYSGTVRIIQPGLAKRTGVMASGRSDGTTAGNPQHHENTGSRKTSVATKGVRLYPISGTLASGTITMYGVLKP
jgi:hypothetical protein